MMDVSIELDHQGTVFTNGETISGRVLIYSQNTITVSKITATLVGESKSVLTRTGGLLMNREEEEVHRFLEVPKVLIPYRRNVEDSSQEITRLGFGYHSFNFSLRIPWFPECSTCPPNSPVSGVQNAKGEPGPRPFKDLPPSMKGSVQGAEVSYRIEVAVTSKRNMFKFTSRKSIDVDVWPIDTQTPSLLISSPNTYPCTKSIQASILGPMTSSHTEQDKNDVYLFSKVNTPIQIDITASFLPDFNLNQGREVAMHLAVKKLNSHPNDLYLQSFQMLLVGYTNIRAGTAKSGEMSCWTIQSLSNIGMEILSGDDDQGTEHLVDPGLWDGKSLQDTAVPTFDTCNFSRRYELEILMGFQCRAPMDQAGRVIFVQMRVPVRVSSGIFPGRELDGSTKDSYEEDLLVTLEDSLLLDADSVEEGERCERTHGARELVDARSIPSSMPPTYDEAMKISVNRGLEREKWRGSGAW